MPPFSERQVGEETLADIAVTYVEIERDGEPYFYSAGSPVTDEWCYLADADDLHELELGTRAILLDEVTRAIFVRCAALMGITWVQDGMVPVLVEQNARGMDLLARAPGMAEANPDSLRRIRDLD